MKHRKICIVISTAIGVVLLMVITMRFGKIVSHVRFAIRDKIDYNSNVEFCAINGHWYLISKSTDVIIQPLRVAKDRDGYIRYCGRDGAFIYAAYVVSGDETLCWAVINADNLECVAFANKSDADAWWRSVRKGPPETVPVEEFLLLISRD